MAQKFSGFSRELITFLNQLEKNNRRDWFQKHKPRYEQHVLQPALEFIEAMEKPMQAISPYFPAVAKRTGGSLMRIYRDTRFSKNKKPYKTNVGIHFRHEMGRDVHAPGFYFHIEPKEVFIAAGIWHPDNNTLRQIREAIDEEPTKWKRVRNGKTFCANYQMEGDSLKRPPRGFTADHPLIEDLKRKDFIGVQQQSIDVLESANLAKTISASFRQAKPLVKFLCEAIQVPF